MTEKIKQLLAYQAVDLECEKVEKRVLNCEERRAAVQMKKKFETLMDNRKKLIAHLEKLKNELSALEQRCTELFKQAESCQNAIKEQYDNMEELEAHMAQLKKINEKMGQISQKITSIMQSAQKADKMLTEQTASANEARDEYQACKAKYDERLREQMPAIEEAKARRAEAAKGVDRELLAKYNNLRANKKVPLAKLEGSTCMGCNMMLPSAIVSRVASATEIVECENCSRILYID